MNFMMITSVVMLLSVSIIYKITNFFGLRLKFKSLLLCAICAFSVNFITLSVSAYLTRSHFILILSAVFLSACLVTYYNERLNRQGMPLTESTHSAIALEPLPKANDPPASDAGWVLPKRRPEQTKHPPAALENAPVVKEVQQAKQTIDTVKRDQKVFHAPAILSETIAQVVQRDMESIRLKKVRETLADLNSLDAILDYAYEEKVQSNFSNALLAFEKALQKFENDAYAPFIVIEMSNIYKDIGLYDEAIASYETALKLPAVASDLSIRENFLSTAEYLRIVKYVLVKHDSLKVPFNQIPRPYMLEIEFNFQSQTEKKHVS